MTTLKPTPALLKARLWMHAAVVSALLAHALQGLSWAIAVGLLSCLASGAMQWAGLHKQPPTWFAKLRRMTWLRWLAPLIAAAAVGVLAWEYRSVFGREVGVTSLTILTAFKLWEYNKPRDAQILAGLLFFLLLSVFLRQESALALACVMVSAVLTLSAWVFFNAQNTESSSSDIATPVSLPWHDPLRETLRLALYGLPLAILLFFVFPRIAGPLWGLPQDAQSSKLGLSNTLEPGRFAKLAGSDELAFRAKFKGTLPTAQQLYWRGPVLSEFDGVLWRQLPWRDEQAIQLQTNVVAELASASDLIHYQLVAEPHKQTFRVLLDTPLYATPDIKLNPQLSPYGEPLLEAQTVQATSDPVLRWGTHAGLSTAQKRLALESERQLPAGFNPRALSFAAQLRQRLGEQEIDPTPFMRALLLFYAASFQYSLEPPTPKGRPQDAIDGFLFDTQSGYCEHFAASFVVLMRAMDFPARIVTGYQGGELNPQDGWMVVPQNAAHAWAEVLHPKLGWLRVDPTAAVAPWRVQLGGNQLQSSAGKVPDGVQGLLKNSREALLPLQQWAQATLRVWQDYGLNYGKNSQKTLFQTLGFDDVSAQAVASVLGTGLALWTLAMLLLHRNRQARRSAHALALAQFDALCLGHKLPRDPAQTPAAWLAKHGSELAARDKEQLTHWLKLYEAAHYARRT